MTMTRRSLAVLMVLSILLTAAVLAGLTTGIDTAWAELMMSLGNPFLATIAHALDVAGGTVGVVVTLLAGSLVLRWRGRLVLAPAWILIVTAATLTSTVLKVTIGRVRPEGGLVEEVTFSYPSGHAVAAAAVAIGLAALCGLAWPAVTRGAMVAAIAWTALMAWSRTYLLVHWLSDVVGGAMIGATVVALVMVALVPGLRPRLGTPDVRVSTER